MVIYLSMKKNTLLLLFVLVLLLIAAVVVVLVLPSLTPVQGTATASNGDAADNKAAVLRLVEAFNDGNSEVVSEIFAPDYVGYIPDNPIIDSTLDATKISELIQLMDSAFPNLQIESELLIQEGNLVAQRAVIHGDFLSEFYDVPPTENPVEFRVNVFYRFNDAGLIVEQWIELDTLDVLQQFGIDLSFI